MRANQKLIPTVNEKVKKRNCLFVWFSDEIKYIKVIKYLEWSYFYLILNSYRIIY